jgi:tetratricopeptide (TPR) repeat protein
MGLEQIYHFTLELNDGTMLFFPEANGKKGQGFQEAVEKRIRALFLPLGGVIQALSVSRQELRLAWQEDNRQPGMQQKIAAMLSGGNALDGMLLLELFLSDDPENPELLYALGSAYADQNDQERAIELLTRLVACAPEHVNGRVAKGAALLKAGRISEGISELETAVRQDPENLWAHRTLGAGLMLLNRYTEAAANLRLAREIDPEDQQAWFEYGQVMEAVGENEQARTAYEKAIEIDAFSGVAEAARKRRDGLGGWDEKRNGE